MAMIGFLKELLDFGIFWPSREIAIPPDYHLNAIIQFDYSGELL
jgi:hypothetical protein